MQNAANTDKGFAGRNFEGSSPRTSERTSCDRTARTKNPASEKFDGIRQWIESIFDSLMDQLCLVHHGARILDGLYARVASKFPVLAAGIWHNWKTYEPRKRSLNAYDL